MRKIVTLSTRRSASFAVAAAAALGASQALADTNIIQNGGFESGSGSSVPNWNIGDPASTAIDTTSPHTGVADLFINNVRGAFGDVVSQTTPVGSVTPGSTYTLSLFAKGTFANGGEAQYWVQFFGPTGTLLSGGDPHPEIFNPGTSYSAFPSPAVNSYTAPSGASYINLQIFAVTGAAPSGNQASMNLDDVSFSTGGSTSGGGGVSVWSAASPGAGDWNTAGNWSNGIPNSVDAEADFFGDITSNQTITNNSSITLGVLNFNNANTYTISGSGSLTMQGSTNPAAVIVQNGAQNINLPLTIASNTSLNVSSGASLLITSPLTVNPGISLSPTGSGNVQYQSTVSVGNGGSFVIGNSTHAQGLTLLGNATASVSASSPSSRKLLQLDNVSLSVTSSLDLNNNDLIVHGGSLPTVSGLVQAGYNNGAWNGTGIKSSSAATDTTHLTALGTIPNTNSIGGALYGSGTTLGLFDGTSPAVGDVLVKYTYYGDTNLDGKVDGSDYSNLDNGFLNHLTGWANGDFNYDGTVNGSDYTLMDNAFNRQGQPIASASALLAASTAQVAGTSAVPEPAALSLLSAGALSLLRRRPRRTDR